MVENRRRNSRVLRDDYIAANITMQTYITDVKALTQTDLV